MKRQRNPAVPRHCQMKTLSLVLAAMTSAPASALDLDYRLGASLLHSDNIRLDESGELSDDVLSPEVQFSGRHDTAVVQANFDGSMRYLDYQDNSYSNETRGEFSGRINWIVSPGRLQLMAEDRLSQQPVNNLSSYSPGNQQRTNVFVAGPTLLARFGETTRGQLDLRYTNSYAEQSTTFNGDRYNLAGKLVWELNPTDSVALNLEGTRVEYDELGSFNDYKRHDGYITYESTLASVDIAVDAGYSRLEPSNPLGNTVSSPLFRTKAIWRASSRSVFDAYASYEFADATENLILNAGDPEAPVTTPVPDPTLSIAPETFRQRLLQAGYTYSGVRADLRIQPFFHRMRYLRAPLTGPSQDMDSAGASVTLSYRLRPQTTLVLYALRQGRDFVEIDRDDRDFTASIALNREFSRHWSAQFNLQRRERDSSVPGQDYTENSVVLAFYYRR